MDKHTFLHPHYAYHGHQTSENLIFNANLQEFASKVSYIANLETAGKMAAEDAYRQIEALWQKFQSYE